MVANANTSTDEVNDSLDDDCANAQARMVLRNASRPWRYPMTPYKRVNFIRKDAVAPDGIFVTTDEIPDPRISTISCWVDGARKQHSSTADMIFSVASIVAFVSRHATLKPGDVIATGTPQRVLLGEKEPQWLKAGDEVSVEIERLGRLTNRLIAR